MAGLTGEAWQETFLVEIAVQGATLGVANMEGITETIDIDQGEKDFDQIVLGNGGRLEKLTPEGITTVTFECYPQQVGSGDISAADPAVGFFDLLNQEDTTFPLKISGTTARDRVRVAIMWTDDTTANDASDVLAAASNKGIRLTFAEGFVTSVKPSFTDGILKVTMMVKFAPFDSSGVNNIQFESHDGSGGSAMPALAQYTSSNKF